MREGTGFLLTCRSSELASLILDSWVWIHHSFRSNKALIRKVFGGLYKQPGNGVFYLLDRHPLNYRLSGTFRVFAEARHQVTQPRTTNRGHRQWVPLLVCLSAFSLVVHLTHRFSQRPAPEHVSVSCGCPQEGWQCLQCDALQWAAPPPKVSPLPHLAVAPFAEWREEIAVSQILPDESRYSRPPPS